MPAAARPSLASAFRHIVIKFRDFRVSCESCTDGRRDCPTLQRTMNLNTREATMPLFIPSRSIDEPGVTPEWLEVQRASKIFDDMCNEFIDKIRPLPTALIPGSVLMQDAEEDDVGLALAMCTYDHYLFVLDHALGASRCVKDPTLIHTPYSCARTVLETCSMLHWLLEPAETTGTDGRFARILELNSRDLWNERKWELQVGEKLGRDEEKIKASFEKKIERLTNIADDLSIPYKPTSKEQRPIFATLLDATPRVGKYIKDADLEYRLYSRVIHCETPALAQTWMVRPNLAHPGELAYNSEMAFRLITNLATWIARASHEYYAYCGHDLNELGQCLRVYFTRLRIHKSRWTWAAPTDAS